MRLIGLAVIFTLGLLLSSPAVEGQPATKIHRLGLLLTGAPPDANVEAFREGLRDLGYVEGQNITIDSRWAGGQSDRWSELVAALLDAKVDVIVTQATPAASTVKRLTTAVPIVMAYAADPVGSGLVANLARPGGNVTGLTTLAPTLSAKRLEILKEAFPGHFASRCPSSQALGLQLLRAKVTGQGQYRDAFASFTRGRADALIMLGDFVLTPSQRTQIVDLVLRSKLPAIYQGKESVDVGGLISYGPNLPAMHRRAAVYVDKILKGAKPGDLPVEQPTKFELVINLKTAKALGLTIPQSILVRADEIIQ
jgi:putative ABC transport system substrate-binding protein